MTLSQSVNLLFSIPDFDFFEDSNFVLPIAFYL